MGNISRLTSLAAAGAGGPAYKLAYSSSTESALLNFSSGSVDLLSNFGIASNTLTYSADGSLIGTADTGGNIKVYTATEDSANLTATATAYRQIRTLDFNSSKNRIAVGVDDTSHCLRLYNLSGSSITLNKTANPSERVFQAYAVKFNSAGQMNWGTRWTDPGIGYYYVYDSTLTTSLGGEHPSQSSFIAGVALYPQNNNRVAVAAYNSVAYQPNLYIYQLSLPSISTLGSLQLPGGSAGINGNPSQFPRPIDYSPDGNYIAMAFSGTSDGTGVYLIDVSNPASMSIVATHTLSNGSAASVSFSPDGQYLALGIRSTSGGNPSLLVFDHKTPGTLNLNASYTGPTNVWCVQFSPVLPE